MNKPQYKPSEKTELLTLDQARERYQLSRQKIEELATKCGAALKIGTAKRYKKRVLDEYINTFEA